MWPWHLGPSPEEHREGLAASQTPAKGAGCGLSLRIPFESAHSSLPEEAALPASAGAHGGVSSSWLAGRGDDGWLFSPATLARPWGRSFSHICIQPLRGYQFPLSTRMILLPHHESFPRRHWSEKSCCQGSPRHLTGL